MLSRRPRRNVLTFSTRWKGQIDQISLNYQKSLNLVSLSRSEDGLDKEKVETSFKRNRTHTSKYTVVTFIPLNLFEQFRRAANCYFLLTLILTLILKVISN